VDAAKAVKKNPSTAHIPIIAYTAWRLNAWKAKVLNANVAAKNGQIIFYGLKRTYP
jgi:hypothetical protein